MRISRAAGSSGVRVGVLEGATREDTGQSIAEYAAYNEFGTSRIPARPFMRSTIAEHSREWPALFAQMVQGKTDNPATFERAWHMVGRAVQGQIVEKIASSMPPPNAESTKKRKAKRLDNAPAELQGMAHVPGTLIQDGYLINSIEYEVLTDARS